MLVLTRKPREEIVIGNNIRITVVDIGPGRVKIGIVAPRDVRIDRQEIHDRIATAAALAAAVPAPQPTATTPVAPVTLAGAHVHFKGRSLRTAVTDHREKTTKPARKLPPKG